MMKKIFAVSVLLGSLGWSGVNAMEREDEIGTREEGIPTFHIVYDEYDQLCCLTDVSEMTQDEFIAHLRAIRKTFAEDISLCSHKYYPAPQIVKKVREYIKAKSLSREDQLSLITAVREIKAANDENLPLDIFLDEWLLRIAEKM